MVTKLKVCLILFWLFTEHNGYYLINIKAIIVACGVRKAWKKEFQGLEKPKQQIKRLHDILAELGMTPRYTMEKAKAIREKREFQQELRKYIVFMHIVGADCVSRGCPRV